MWISSVASTAVKPNFSRIAFVFGEDLPLKNAEALVRIGAPAHVQAGLVIFQRRPAFEDAVER